MDKKILIFLDFIIILISMLLGYAIRFSWHIFPDKGIAPLKPYIHISIFAALIWIVMLNVNRIYKEHKFINLCFELSKIIQSSFYSAIIISALTFFYRGFYYSRIAIILGILISFFILSLVHLIINVTLAKEDFTFYLVGDNRDMTPIVKRLKLHGIPENRIIFQHVEQLQFSVQNSDRPDNIRVIICLEDFQKIQQIARICSNSGIQYYVYPRTSRVFLSGGRVEEIYGIPVITTDILPLEIWHNKVIKRFFDILFSMAFLTISMPFLFLIATIIKFSSDGPVFFIQERTGYRNKKFKIFKFRTMVKGAENILPYTLEKDSRITKIGTWLRKSNIDELPQLFNVLKSDMSIVGPRPLSTEDRLFFSIPGFYERMKILPGITGWAQIHGLKGGQVEPEERFRYDLYYAENWSIWLDFAIIIFTGFLFFRDK
ncbi:MAG TPA: exopolysaccharide biosynthesis polyprenyl glycosylphosphotransferase [bacterium]|nr:exopolysaccharide biosynthesis polyprenyl glycosylphosphotransferase [bacterium]HPO51199.1 exopolysaccharide biosynthesis polyprenyl glycosylphosphotransferase [bacterium]